MSTQAIPDGFLKDAHNRLVPIEIIEPIDLERNDLVIGLVEKAKKIKKLLTEFKLESFGDIAALQEMSAEQYGVKMGGKKGNITLPSFDGRYKIQRSIADNISFDERLQVAKELIDQCIHRWSDGVDSKVRALVEHAFQVDKEGKINTGRVLTLRRIKIDDEQWQQAMEAIADSIQVSGSTTYLRLYERVGETDQFESIALDLAKV
jgi:hypothetical protein